MPDISVDRDQKRQELDAPPPQPPRQGKSLMSMATDNRGGQSQGIDMSNPVVKAMALMGDIKKSMVQLGTILPNLAQGLQQMVMGLEQVVPQEVADMVAGNPPGQGGAGLGSPQANATPTAPPVQQGMP